MNQLMILDTTRATANKVRRVHDQGRKVRIARMRSDGGWNVIEAGFPHRQRPGDFEGGAGGGAGVKDSVVCGWAPPRDADIDRPARR